MFTKAELQQLYRALEAMSHRLEASLIELRTGETTRLETSMLTKIRENKATMDKLVKLYDEA